MLAAAKLIIEIGSSPRMRGKLPAERVDIVTKRLIPAHAGKTPRLGVGRF